MVILKVSGSSIPAVSKKKTGFVFTFFSLLKTRYKTSVLTDTFPICNIKLLPALLLRHSRISNGFPRGSAIKNPPAKQGPHESWFPSLGWEDALEEGTAMHSSVLAWRIPWTEEPDGLQSREFQSQTRLKQLSIRAPALK